MACLSCRIRSENLTSQQLRKLIVFHPDRQYLADVKSLETYILDGMNVAGLTVTLEEGRLQAGAKRLIEEEKLLEALEKAKKFLPTISPDQVERYQETGEINLHGITLEKRHADLLVSEQAELIDVGWYSLTDGDAVILVDVQL